MAASLLTLLLVGPAYASDGQGWQGWAFEIRSDDRQGWAGAWSHADCESLRLASLAEHVADSIGACHPVILVDQPPGLDVWLAFADDKGFLVARTLALCDDEPPSSPRIRPVANVAPGCQRLWLRLPV